MGLAKCLLNPIIERIEMTLSMWKSNYLSFGGRITLIEVIVSNLLVYFMSLVKCAVIVVKCIEDNKGTILWQGAEEECHSADLETVATQS